LAIRLELERLLNTRDTERQQISGASEQLSGEIQEQSTSRGRATFGVAVTGFSSK